MRVEAGKGHLVYTVYGPTFAATHMLQVKNCCMPSLPSSSAACTLQVLVRV